MKALFSGQWGDTWLFDIIIGGLKDNNKGFPSEKVTVITDGSETSERAAGMASARHGLSPVKMDKDNWPNMVFVLHDGLPKDQKELEYIGLFLDDGVPVYHIRHMDRETVRRLRSAAERPARPAPRVPTRSRRSGGPPTRRRRDS